MFFLKGAKIKVRDITGRGSFKTTCKTSKPWSPEKILYLGANFSFQICFFSKKKLFQKKKSKKKL